MSPLFYFVGMFFYIVFIAHTSVVGCRLYSKHPEKHEKIKEKFCRGKLSTFVWMVYFESFLDDAIMDYGPGHLVFLFLSVLFWPLVIPIFIVSHFVIKYIYKILNTIDSVFGEKEEE